MIQNIMINKFYRLVNQSNEDISDIFETTNFKIFPCSYQSDNMDNIKFVYHASADTFTKKERLEKVVNKKNSLVGIDLFLDEFERINFKTIKERHLIVFDSASLGDTIAWIPYVEEYRLKHGTHVILSTFWNNLFEKEYSEIEFIKPGSIVQNISRQYNIGWYCPWDSSKNPNHYMSIPLQQTASDILGLEYKEIKPKITLPERCDNLLDESKSNKNNRCFVLFCDKPYYDYMRNALILLDSFSTYNVIAYTINFTPEDNFKNIIWRRLDDEDLLGYQEHRRSHLIMNDWEKNIYMCCKKIEVIKKSLEEDFDEFVYLDADVFPTKNINKIFDMSPKNLDYPVLPRYEHEIMIYGDKGNPWGKDGYDETKTLEWWLIQKFQLERVYKRSHYRQSCFFYYNKKCKSFFDRCYNIASDEEVLKNYENFFGDESIINILLWVVGGELHFENKHIINITNEVEVNSIDKVDEIIQNIKLNEKWKDSFVLHGKIYSFLWKEETIKQGYQYDKEIHIKINKYFVDKLIGGEKLHLGCHNHMIDGWINSDIICNNDRITYLDVTKKFPYEDSSIDYIFSEHLIEHISYQEGVFMLKECFRVLKAGGKIRISTPDLKFLIDMYNSNKTELQNQYIDMIYKASISDEYLKIYYPVDTFVINNFFTAWGHKFIYDKKTLIKLLESVGFYDLSEHRLLESDDINLKGLENVGRMAEGLLQLESFTLEAVKP